MLLRALHKAPRAAPSCARAFSAGVEDGPAATNLVWSELLSTDERKAILEKSSRAKHAGCTVWLTGLSGSGKSTVGALLETKLLAKGVHAYRLDGDNIRMGLNKDLAFSEEDREENIRRIGEVSALFSDAGIVSICAFISPYRKSRRAARACHSALKQPFIEVHVHAPLEEAESRDPKGLYKKARAGIIKNFTGIDDPYEAPESPEVRLDTHESTVDECADILVAELQSIGVLDKNL